MEEESGLEEYAAYYRPSREHHSKSPSARMNGGPSTAFASSPSSHLASRARTARDADRRLPVGARVWVSRGGSLAPASSEESGATQVDFPPPIPGVVFARHDDDPAGAYYEVRLVGTDKEVQTTPSRLAKRDVDDEVDDREEVAMARAKITRGANRAATAARAEAAAPPPQPSFAAEESDLASEDGWEALETTLEGEASNPPSREPAEIAQNNVAWEREREEDAELEEEPKPVRRAATGRKLPGPRPATPEPAPPREEEEKAPASPAAEHVVRKPSTGRRLTKPVEEISDIDEAEARPVQKEAARPARASPSLRIREQASPTPRSEPVEASSEREARFAGWDRILDPNSKCYYYYQVATNKTLWDTPETRATLRAAETAAEVRRADGPRKAAPRSADASRQAEQASRGINRKSTGYAADVSMNSGSSLVGYGEQSFASPYVVASPPREAPEAYEAPTPRASTANNNEPLSVRLASSHAVETSIDLRLALLESHDAVSHLERVLALVTGNTRSAGLPRGSPKYAKTLLEVVVEELAKSASTLSRVDTVLLLKHVLRNPELDSLAEALAMGEPWSRPAAAALRPPRDEARTTAPLMLDDRELAPPKRSPPRLPSQDDDDANRLSELSPAHHRELPPKAASFRRPPPDLRRAESDEDRRRPARDDLDEEPSRISHRNDEDAQENTGEDTLDSENRAREERAETPPLNDLAALNNQLDQLLTSFTEAASRLQTEHADAHDLASHRALLGVQETEKADADHLASAHLGANGPGLNVPEAAAPDGGASEKARRYMDARPAPPPPRANCGAGLCVVS